MKKTTGRLVKVKDMPATWILIDSKLSDEEIKNNWLEKQERLNLTPSMRGRKIKIGLSHMDKLRKRRKKYKEKK